MFGKKYGKVARAAVSAALSGAMLFSGIAAPAVTALAGEVKVANSVAQTQTFMGYQLFKATVVEKLQTIDGAEKKVNSATDVAWSGVKAVDDAVLMAIKKDTSITHATMDYKTWLMSNGYITSSTVQADIDTEMGKPARALAYITDQIGGDDGTEKVVDGYTVKKTPANTSFASYLASEVAKQSSDLTATSTDGAETALTFDNGFALILPQSTTDATKGDGSAVPMFTFVRETGTPKVIMKGAPASLTKKVIDTDKGDGEEVTLADFGMKDEIGFKLVATVPTDATTGSFTLKDTLPAGMTVINAAAGVTVSEVTKNEAQEDVVAVSTKFDVTITSENGQSVITVTNKDNKDFRGKYIIEYKAKLSQTSTTGDEAPNINTATLTVGDETTMPQSSSVTTYRLNIANLKDSGEALTKDAKFVIADKDGYFINKDGSSSNITNKEQITDALIFTPGENGVLENVPLIDSNEEYTIYEIGVDDDFEFNAKAHAGIKVKLDLNETTGELSLSLKQGETALKLEDFNASLDAGTGIASIDIRNDRKIILPITGMTPSQLGTVMGAVLIAAGVVAITARRRQGEEA